jgi:hypothetical protein
LDHTELLDLLKHLQSLLATARKAVSGSGRHEDVFEIDALVGVAQEEVRRKIRSLEAGRNGPSLSGVFDVAE